MRRDRNRVISVVLLMHVSAAADYQALFPLAERFHFLWDTADAPTPELLECTQLLAETESLTDGRWGGFHVGNHWLREHPASEENRETLVELLAPLAA